MSPVNWWHEEADPPLAQGDYLEDCLLPTFSPDFGPAATAIPVAKASLIVVSQTCDLANDKTLFVANCRVHRLAAFEKTNPKVKWEEVRKGRWEGLHLLSSFSNPADNRLALVVDFREIVSLPFAYLKNLASSREIKWRIRSPFLEHFSQAFARFFMRVGLPAAIPPFK